LGDILGVVILGIFAAIVSIISFSTGKDLPDFINSKETQVVIHIEPTSTNRSIDNIPTQTTTATQTGNDTTQASETKNIEWKGDLSVRKPTLNEIREEIPVSLWDSNQLIIEDMLQPGIDKYYGKATFGKYYLFPVFWCSTSFELLTENMDKINTEIIINGETVPEKFVFVFDFETNNDWICRYHSVVLGNWLRNKEYILDIKRIFEEDIIDGESEYEAGEYIYRLIVSVK
jgi:hypothetical protein